MAIEWTGLGPDLLVRLEREASDTLGAQLQGQLRDAIRAGRLAVGERLPSSRQLAGELGVSRGLVVDCYAQLEAEGYLVTRVGSATRVAASTAAQPAAAAKAVAAPVLDVDFRYGVPDLASFPMRDWLWAMADATRSAPIAAGDYGESRGSTTLRGVIAAYLRRVRGSAADPELTVICTGFAQGITLVLRALAEHGVCGVALEDPGQTDISVRAPLDPVPIPVDERGIDVAALAASGARAVVVTPAHQSPTGVVLAPERRQALVSWANDVDGFVIEDDYDAEFRYDRQPVGSLQGLAPDRVVSVGSVSKSLAPAMRLGWLVTPPALAEAIFHEKEVADRGSPVFDQLALARLIESGRYDRHLRRMRGVYSARRNTLVEALAEHAPSVALTGLAAGFHAVAHLAPGADEQAVIAAARERGIGLHGMSEWRSSGSTVPPQLVMGFGNVTETAIRRGIGAVGDLVRS